MASLRAFAARKRTTVFALILIASPVCGLRPMRALRCAFTTRPMFGMTNLPAPPLASFTASLNSSSKNCAATFLEVKEAKGGAGKFVIPNIGRVVKAHRKARMGRNPQTGEAIKIKAKTVVRLRAAKALKDAVLGS